MEDSADNPFARSELNGRQAFIRRLILTVAIAVTPFNLKGGGVSLDFLKPLFEAILDSFQNLGMNKVQIPGTAAFSVPKNGETESYSGPEWVWVKLIVTASFATEYRSESSLRSWSLSLLLKPARSTDTQINVVSSIFKTSALAQRSSATPRAFSVRIA